MNHFPNHNLEYVSSGNEFPRIITSSSGNLLSNKYKQLYINLFNDILKNLKNNNIKYSMLFNAYTEAKYPKALELFRHNLHAVHSDSGGLQVITTKASITNSDRNNIFKTQGLYSDMPMSFDDIPVVVDNKVSRTTMSGKYWDDININNYIKNSAVYYALQIDYFKKNNFIQTPFLIIHGYNIETLTYWFDNITKYLSDIGIQQPKNIALGGGGLTFTKYLHLTRAAFLATINDKIQNAHLLGVGSCSNLSLYNSFHKFNKYNFNLSYDSTTHTSAISRGEIFINGKLRRQSQVFNETIKKINCYFPGLLRKHNIPEDDDTITRLSVSKIKDKYGDKKSYVASTLSLLFFIISVLEFMHKTEITSDDKIDDFILNNDYSNLHMFKHMLKYKKIPLLSDKQNSINNII